MKTLAFARSHLPNAVTDAERSQRGRIEQPYDLPDSLAPAEEPDAEPDEPSDLDDLDTTPDDARWDVFIPDEDEYEPDLRDFEGSIEPDYWDEDFD